MTNLDALTDALRDAKARLKIPASAVKPARHVDPELAFYAPLVAFSVLVAVQVQKNCSAIEIASIASAALSQHFLGLDNDEEQAQHSAIIRRRFVDALVFLENAGLVQVGAPPNRPIRCTPAASSFLRKANRDENDLGVIARGLHRAQARSRLRAHVR